MLYTAQISASHRILGDIEKVDITIKSSVAPWNVFAPTWAMVEGFKDGSLTEEEYQKRYLALMRERYKEYKVTFQQLIEKALKSDIALACYCPPGVFCHRLLLADILTKIEPHIMYIGEVEQRKKEMQLTLFNEE